MNDCGNDENRADSRVCRRRCDIDAPLAADRQFDQVCGPPVGTLNGNVTLTAVQSASNCKSGFAISQSSTGQVYCSEPCSQNTDCPSGTQCTFTSRSLCGTVEDGHLYCRRP